MSTVSGGIPASAAPAWAVAMRRFNNRLMYDLGGGPRPWKFSWIINFQKGGTFLFLGALMWLYSARTPAATSTAAWIYLALHGTYGLAWLVKDFAFPDPGWQQRITIGGGLFALFGLAMYWSFGWLLISGTSQPHYPLPDAAWFCLCISLCMLGSVIMVAADAQKFFTLRVKRGLITDGLHRWVRHPNYLGEMMVYGSFALMVWHWLPVLWLAYKRRSWWLLPFVF
jgi:protein-S-isoprenylcysteine O-methyltransferase Ste14